MTGPGENSTTGGAGGSDTLHGPGSTGSDNLFGIEPFSVRVEAYTQRWDPQSHGLPVVYRIVDPNHRVRSGRILYMVPAAEGAREIVHIQPLTSTQILVGRHELAEDQRWDGVITRGLTDRIDQRVMVDLSPVWVRVEIWNTSGDYAAGPGRQLSLDSRTADIEAIAEARWDNHRCIPYDDPDEPELGVTTMVLRVKNVQEGTPVRIRVARIKDIANPLFDQAYVETGEDPANQPDLEGAAVRSDEVLLPSGIEPAVRWNRYDQHWPEENENNFYCFHVAFGPRGQYMIASQRNYDSHERECLHMRFTVFIHAPSTNLSYHVDAARALNRFFQNRTDYFRSYMKIRPFRSVSDLVKHMNYRYIVIIFCHSSCACDHAGHPRRPDGSLKRVFQRRFSPDQNACPDDLPETAVYGGCGHREGIEHHLYLGRLPSNATPAAHAGKELWLGNDQTWNDDQRLLLSVEGVLDRRMHIRRGPRFLFHTGGCRTMLTSNLGEYWVKSGAKFYSGWTYVGLDYAENIFSRHLFRRWIKGTSAEPAPAEYLTQRFIQAHARASSLSQPSRYYPRLIDRTCNPVPPGQYEAILS
jgi:hypothetical protein